MKECKRWFRIAFELDGQRIEQQVDLNSQHFKKGKPGERWHFYFWVKDLLIDLFGSVDQDGDVRTSGDIGDGQCSAFGIDVYGDLEHSIDQLNRHQYLQSINDIDWLESDID